MTLQRLNVLDAPVDAVDTPGALDFVAERIRQPGQPGYLVAMNPEKIYALRQDAFLREFVAGADLVFPDGIGIVWAARVLHGRRLERVPGADLMQAICAHAPERGWRIFLYGASEEVSRGAAAELLRRHPRLQLAGRANGFVPAAGMEALVAQINASGADILFVALGSPRQEHWIRLHLPRLNVKLIQGIGGTLDTITGHVRRAPRFIQRCHLEWLYRLLCQPSRAGRQLKLARFVLEVLTSPRQGS